MSNFVTNKCRLLVLPRGQKAVIMALADTADDDGFCWPSQLWLQQWTCLRRTAVIEAMKGLERAGLITVERHCGRTNLTTINLESVVVHKQFASRTGRGLRTSHVANSQKYVSETGAIRGTDRTRTTAGPNTSVPHCISDTPVKENIARSKAAATKDPALLKIEEDRRRSVPPPATERAKWQAIRLRTK